MSVYDLEARSEKRLVDDAVSVELSADGGKLLVARAGSWSIVPVASSGSGASTSQVLATGSLEMTVDPAAEWRQMYDDAWRIERDFFYDPAMHGIDWNAMRARYAPLLGRCATRHDVNAVLGELLGELSSSHTYRSGGDLDLGASRAVGYLGCDFAPAQGALRIRRILETAPWDTVHSPLRAPGLDVREGEYLLAVNGDGIEATREPWAAFQGLADQAVLLTINSKPNVEGARDVLVQTLASEANLRQCAWIEANRQRVEQATDGRAGYVYVSNTGDSGQADLYRQWRAQTHKLALVIDERWNSGGHTPDRFVELLARRATNYWHVRDGRDWTTPLVVQQGPKAMLINGWSGSGGDNFAHLFRVNRLGPLIGTRTWGGLIGITGAPRLVDGGNVTVPTFRIYDADGRWIIEGAGVQPDIEVPEDPTRIARGIDPQLERAIAVVCDALDKNPPHQPAP